MDLDEYVRQLVEQAPPLTAEQRALLAALLRPIRATTGTRERAPLNAA